MTNCTFKQTTQSAPV